MKFPFPVLLSDIGGTNARFALAPAPGAPIEPGPHLKTADFPGLEEAIASARQSFSAVPQSMIACAAGPVDGHKIAMTNAPWVIDGRAVAKAAGLAQGLLLNDFEAQALSLAALPDASVRWIGKPRPAKDAITKGSQLILGPGTGLGASVLLGMQGRVVALPSEAGHVDFGPTDLEETKIWGKMAGPPFRITAESLLSGPGLLRLHHARLASKDLEIPDLDDAALVEKACAYRDSEEARSVRHFLHLIARFAGDLALVFLAKGGVTLAGGILPRIVDFIDDTDFRSVFENKPPHKPLMQTISTRLITATDSVMGGMAAIAENPGHYIFDDENRAWCLLA